MFPDLVAPAVAGFGVVAILLLLVGAYRPALVLPLGLAAAVLLAIPAARLAPSDGRGPGPALAAGVIAVAFGLVSGVWSGQYLDSNLDPGTYANAGLWLVHHPSLKIAPMLDVFGSSAGALQPGAPGWFPVGSHLFAQGNHGLPAFLAAGGWLGGPNLLLRTNAVLGAAALLALFAFSRRFVSGWWSVLPVAIAAASQPFAAFSRTTYTEPLAATLVLGGLALLVPAVRTRSLRGLALAGFVIGATCIARPDAYLCGVGVVVAGGIAACASPQRRWSLLFAPFAAWLVPALVGTADLRVLSRVYFDDLAGEIKSEFALTVVSFVAAFLVVAYWPGRRNQSESPAPVRRRRGLIAAAIVVVVAVALISRPLWITQPGHQNAQFGQLQHLLGQTVNTSRSYGEHTVSWIAWYYGWPTIILAVAGLALLVRRTLAQPRPEWAGPLAVVAVDAALFLVKPSITPYQIWAIRRFVPIVIPACLVGAAYALASLFRRGRIAAAVSIALALVAIVIPAVVLAPVFTVRDHTPDLQQARMLCRAVGPNAAVLMLDTPADQLSRTMAAMCGSVTAQTVGRVDRTTLADVHNAAAAHGRQLYVVASNPAKIQFRTPPAGPTTALAFTAWWEEIVRSPHRAKHWQPAYWIARVGEDGRADAVTG